MKHPLILILLCLPTSLIAQNEIQLSPPPPNPPLSHLEPVEDFFSMPDYHLEYFIRLRDLLFKGLVDEPEIRFLILPSFTPESVLEIQYHKEINKYFSVYHTLEKTVWLNKQWKKVKTIEYKKEISKESAELVKSLFKAAIRDAQYPTWNNSGLDGTTYFFSYSDWGLRTAFIWEPNEASTLGHLIYIGQKLIELTKENDQVIKFEEDFKTEISNLTSKF